MRTFKVVVEGKAYEVQVEEINGVATAPVAAPVAPVAAPVVAPVAAPAAPVAKPAAPAGGTPVKAPMPGMVVSFKVPDGTPVKKGQAVVVLEAMKMENDIAAPADGIFTAVASKGETVNTGAVLGTIA